MTNFTEQEKLTAAKLAVDLYDLLPKMVATLDARGEVLFDYPEDEITHQLSRVSAIIDGIKIEFWCCTPDHSSHGIQLFNPDSKTDLWFEVRGWVELRIDGNSVYSQRLLASRGWQEDDFTGDLEAFLKVASMVMDLNSRILKIILKTPPSRPGTGRVS